MRAFRLGFLFLLLVVPAAFAALQFPALTGRVVDEAHILSSRAVAELDQALENYERGTSNQVVVVTLGSLNGDSIEDYGYQLGRAWHIGQQGKNNGVLLIIAPAERKVRIEVGYGLEGVLTDAISSEIVQGIILPKFRSGDMEAGVVDGTRAILDVLGGKSLPATAQPLPINEIEVIIFLAIIVLSIIGKFVLLCSPRFYLNHPFLAMLLLMSGSPSRFGSSGLSNAGWGGGGGFSGGGGSFGGGGASGSW